MIARRGIMLVGFLIYYLTSDPIEKEHFELLFGIRFIKFNIDETAPDAGVFLHDGLYR
jgi:hypothetical protein